MTQLSSNADTITAMPFGVTHTAAQQLTVKVHEEIDGEQRLIAMATHYPHSKHAEPGEWVVSLFFYATLTFKIIAAPHRFDEVFLLPLVEGYKIRADRERAEMKADMDNALQADMAAMAEKRF